jgi:hypothetical protein
MDKEFCRLPKKGVSYMPCSGREYMSLPQCEDQDGRQKPWFSRSGAEKERVRSIFFNLTKAYEPHV